jgi:RNA polymerase sigma-70 factor (ECF subfamily)
LFREDHPQVLETQDDFVDLMGRVREGSEEAAWEIVDRYGDAIRRAVRRALHARLRSKFDSLDFVQLVWCSFFKGRDQVVRFGRPEELAAFLLRLARNKVGLETRRRLMTKKYNLNREQTLSALPDTVVHPANHDSNPVDVAIAREQWNRLIADQPDRNRQIISMRLQGVSCQDIATSLNLAECTVRRFLNRLLNNMVL